MPLPRADMPEDADRHVSLSAFVFGAHAPQNQRKDHAVMETVTHVQWQAIEARLKTPFPPQEVHFRLQGTPREVQGKLHGQVVAYVDARAVMNRLDEVVGPENWSFRWEPIAVVNGKVT